MSHPEIGEHAAETDIANYGASNSPKDIIIPHNPYPNTISIHIHHWQIFYTLAFFTRFTYPVSQVGAGIVLACYMQGIFAYGYDCLVNDNN
ncbi:hypothetical protein G6F46_001647 [Rhizopus delemar]|uniref:Uncharacterized protein n=2 Tax=Rhizopus TaxID=4842 RepID=A0A9P6Z7E6_9FUNG|nr:hypothetical protein G6F55_001043 [Rhizopus delemar]KAG1547536.1 hypothetical protein G6F51_004202 [Rhizopus arrhizus]KAG1504184.1 hypothetical protein G6F54_001169 [Rhizopus delemar]KAG1514501.1 hypothetical protein G6F53_003619 [Rhizopus delemar]KAG1528289.1 hypothetical protein G6F52_000769 [Rhizopus delemar]